MSKALFIPLQLSLGTVACMYAAPILAQVTSDGTVNTQVNQNGNVTEITGGETRGSNLFHSFQDFSVSTGNEAFFNNADNINNIFSRVTGGNISNIDGAIRANDTASLFLINPAGIIFGENARLDIGGSFYGSTASSILFEDGEFSAADLENPPLLTVNAPIGLGFRDNPGDIVNRSVADGIGLSVLEDQNISLIGGNVNIENGGMLFAPAGKVELGGLLETGTINIAEDNSLNFPDGVARGDVSLADSSVIEVFSSNVSGEITFNAGNITIQLSRLESSVREGSIPQGGEITLNATGDINLQNTNINAPAGFFQFGGSIILDAGQSIYLNSSELDVTSFGGTAGNILIKTVESVFLEASRATGFAGFGVRGGNIAIDAKSISLNESLIAVSATGGTSGNISLKASDFINISGNEGFNAALFSDGGFGQSEGSGGNIEIIGKSVTLSNGGSVSANADGVGNAGIIFIKADDFVNLDNVSISSALNLDSFGNGGDVNITANSLSLANGANINASTLSEARDSANINLQIAEDITLRNNSFISATASNNAGGGNINIDSRFIIAFPNGNNDILASAEQGQGGNITINAESLFGIQEDTPNDATNDINASSEVNGLDGTINISTPDINPVQGVTELPTNVVTPEETAQQACEANRELAAKNGFSINGKGGIIPDPGLPLNSSNVSVNGESTSTQAIPAPIETAKGKIQPARGVKVTDSGEIILTAYRTNSAGERIHEGSRNCDRV